MQGKTFDVPAKLGVLFETKKRFIDIYGGRGSGKSWAVADFLLVKGRQKKVRILCAREIQTSIKDSVHKLLSDRIAFHGLNDFYTITDKSIKGYNGTEFIFKGLFRNEQDVKSTEGINYCWCEESQSISRKSLEVLTPTIRAENSQIIFTYNPTMANNPVHVDYTLADRADTLKLNVNYDDNPWFPEVLRNEMEYDKRTDYDKYRHKWLGECVTHSEAQIFYGKWTVKPFDSPVNANFYFGADFGFAKDASTLIRSYIDNENNLYIDYEWYAVGVDIDKMPACYATIPESRKWNIVADSSRPETISALNNAGFRMEKSKKGAGSVLDGIELIRSFEHIYIHPRCKHTIDEFSFYSFKIDKLTGNISPVPEDRNNHIVDALRYALEGVKQYATVLRYDTYMDTAAQQPEYAQTLRF